MKNHTLHSLLVSVILLSGAAIRTGTADEAPFYLVISPNGGETFHVGDTVTVKLASHSYGNAGCDLVIGRYSFPLAGLMGYSGSFNPSIDSVSRFVVPDSFITFKWNAQTQNMDEIPFIPVSDSCRIHVFDYPQATMNVYYDYSDSFFSIKSPVAVRDSRPRQVMMENQPLIRVNGDGRTIRWTGTGIAAFALFDLSGRMIAGFTLSPSAPGYSPAQPLHGVFILSMEQPGQSLAMRISVF